MQLEMIAECAMGLRDFVMTTHDLLSIAGGVVVYVIPNVAVLTQLHDDEWSVVEDVSTKEC
jgi:hypothetical protein